MNYALTIRQGDQYNIPVNIKANGKALTNKNCKAVRVCIGNFCDEWPKGNMSFNDGHWLFRLTQDMSLNLPYGEVDLQFQYTENGIDFHTSDIIKVKVLRSAFGKWEGM